MVDREIAKAQYLAPWEAEHILREAGEVIEDPVAGRLCPVKVAALSAWRMTKGVFRFDQTLWSRLIKADIAPDMAGHIMRRLPQWCIYVETEGRLSEHGVEGVFAFVESHAMEQAALHLILDEKGGLRHVPISLSGTMWRAVRDATEQWVDEACAANLDGDVLVSQRVSTGIASVVEATVRLLTYLCCKNVSVGERGRLPQNPMPVRAGSGWAMFPADRPTVWRVGAIDARHGGRASGTNESRVDAGHFDVREILRRGGNREQEVVWLD
jgi:hypothetical protein